jgi:hypothetical protein
MDRSAHFCATKMIRADGCNELRLKKFLVENCTRRQDS